jgi:OmpA-OmpF porin, OOP family
MQARKLFAGLALLTAGTLAVPVMAAAPATEPTGTWYLGVGIGQSRASIDSSTANTVLAGTGATAVSGFTTSTATGAKAFLGYQFNRYIAAEGGYFRLGDFSFDATTTPAGTLHGSANNRSGYNLDVVGTLPVVPDRFLVLARLGVQSSKTSDLFNGTGAAAALANPSPSKTLVSYKYGTGAEFDFTKNIGVRAEWERYRVSDGIGGKVNVNLVSASLLYRY